MKTLLLILTILLFFATIGISAIYLMKNQDFNQLTKTYIDLKADYTLQTAQYKDAQEKYTDLEKIAYPKVFPSRSTLEKWVKDNTSYNSQTSYSEDAVKLMEAARKEGYWMGIAVAEKITTNDRLTLQVPVYPYYTGANLYVYNIAVVGESDLYAVDPAVGSVLKMAEMMAKMR
jgi:hypothetical protein